MSLRPLVLLVLCLAACNVDRAGRAVDDGGNPDMGCASEPCDGVDAGYDGMIDEGFDLSSDLFDCGACTFANASAACVSSVCALGACNAGFADCDLVAETGCESDLSSTTTCGRCGRACAGGELCSGGACLRPNAVAQIGAGVGFSCARLTDGRVFCWGANASGQLGNGTSADSSSAAPVSGIDDASDLAVGALHACVVHAAGTVSCWGENAKQQLGDGLMVDRSTPAAGVGGVTDARQLSAGAEHTCVIRATGAVSCWGRDNVGQLGDATTGGDRSNGIDVVLPEVALQVECGAAHTCAVLASGKVRCWGENAGEQLGDGTTMDSAAPVRAGLLGDVVQLTAGEAFTCAVRSGGSAECWGDNGSAQLGDGTTVDRSASAPVSTLAGAVEVSCGSAHACARSSAGVVSCWGANGSGRVGDGTTTERSTPVTVTGAMSVRGVTAGADHSCAAQLTGTAVCWGENGSGQLGDGTTTDSAIPVRVTGLP